MTISHLLTESCTILQRRPSGRTDSYGNPIMSVYQVEAPTHVQSSVGSVGATGVIYTAKAYFNPDTNISDDDVIRVRGKQYWVNSAELHVSPTGNPLPYISVLLRETEERQVITHA